MSPATVTLVLISHTNAGKTTLARTLAGIDVGEVRDAPHVTTMSQAVDLLATPEGDRLQLWDTPGFGDSVRLFRRLRMSGNPIGWFLREVIDRFRDRPFWLSQQALRTARDSADIVLYLVNSSEDPRDCGYLAPELAILDWLGKPVVVLLNQMGPPRPQEQELAEQARWRSHLDGHAAVRGVIALDAFARCWVHERVFYETLAPLAPPDKHAGYARLAAVWEGNNRARYRRSIEILAAQVAAAARDSEPLTDERGARAAVGRVVDGLVRAVRGDREPHDKAHAALMDRLNAALTASTAALLREHRLDAGEAVRINRRVQDAFVVNAPVDPKQAGLLGAVLSGAATGLSADLVAGGMTLGAGALLGGLIGAVTFSGAAWAFNAQNEASAPGTRFSEAFLRSLVVAGLLRYLAVAHFGRGRGNFVEGEAPAFWQKEVEDAVALHDPALAALWPRLRAQAESGTADAELAALLDRIAQAVLARLYPRG